MMEMKHEVHRPRAPSQVPGQTKPHMSGEELRLTVALWSAALQRPILQAAAVTQRRRGLEV